MDKRESLLLEHYDWISGLVRSWIKNKPISVKRDIDSYQNAAYLAFWQCLEKWDEKRSLKSYSYMRIIGSLIDQSRLDDYCSRGDRSKYNYKFRRLNPNITCNCKLMDKLITNIQFEDITAKLDDKTKRICRKVWLDGETQKDVATQEKLSKSRICDILQEVSEIFNQQ